MLTFQIEKQRHEKTLIGSLQSKWKKALKKMYKASMNSMSIALSIIMILAVTLFINMRNTQKSKQRNLQSGGAGNNWSYNQYMSQFPAATPMPRQPSQFVQTSIPPTQSSSQVPASVPPTPPSPPPAQQYPSPPAAASAPLVQQLHYGQPPLPIPATALPVATPIIQMQSLGAAPSLQTGQTQIAAAPPVPLPQSFVQPLPPSQPQQLPLLYAAAAQPIPPTAGNPLSATMMPGQPHVNAAAGSPPNSPTANPAGPSPISQLLWLQQIMVQKFKESVPQGSIRCRDAHKLVDTFEKQISAQLQLREQTDQQWKMLQDRQRKLSSIFKEQFPAAQQPSPVRFDFKLISDENCARRDERRMISIGSARDDGDYFYEFIRLLFSENVLPRMVRGQRGEQRGPSWPRTVGRNLKWWVKRAFGGSYRNITCQKVQDEDYVWKCYVHYHVYS